MSENNLAPSFRGFHGPRNYEDALAWLNSGDEGPKYIPIDFNAPLLALEGFRPSEGAMKIDAFEKSIESLTLRSRNREEKLREIEEKYAALEKYLSIPETPRMFEGIDFEMTEREIDLLKLKVWESLKTNPKAILQDFLPKMRIIQEVQLFPEMTDFTRSIDVAINVVHDYKLREHLMNILSLNDTYNPLLVLNRKKRNGIRIMSKISYDRVIEYFDYAIKNEKLPDKIIPVPYFTVSKLFIRYTFYRTWKANEDVLTRDLTIDFLHAVFKKQFPAKKKGDTDKKFATEFTNYDGYIEDLFV